MKYLSLFFIVAILLTGCAREAVYADREYGVASMDTYDQLIVYKDYRYADKTNDDMDGLHAEPIMETYQSSFGEGFTQETIEVASPGSN